MKPAYYYDIETENWTTFVVGALWDASGACLGMWSFHREDDFIRTLIALKGEVYAHNGGKFDHLWLLDGIIRLGIAPSDIRIIKNSAGIISIKIGDASFRDTYRIFPMSLAKLTGGGKESLRDLCTCNKKNCGGYCAIRRDAARPVIRRIKQYLEADGRELAKAVDRFSLLATKLNLEVGSTIGATAWNSAKSYCSLPSAQEIYSSKARWEFAKESYYGGRCEIYRQYAGRYHGYDVNSMYPSRLRLPLPVGEPQMRYGEQARSSYLAAMPGAYRASIESPTAFIPVLPIKYKNRIGYPTGHFSGIWTLPELKYAEECGYKIESIEQALVWHRSEIIFTDWVENIYSERFKAGKDTSAGLWLKLVPNSFTGKCGSRCEMTTVIINPSKIRAHNGKCGNDCDGLCGAYRLLSRPGAATEIYESSVWRLQDCAHVIWAAYITSYSRIELHKQQMQGGGSDNVYCDTDGIKCLSPREHNIGPKLGQWMDEGPRERGLFIAPKVYAEDIAGKLKVKAKGIPVKDWDKITRGEPIEYHTFSGGFAGEGRFFVRRKATRTIKVNTGMRIADPGAGSGLTRPPSYSEFIQKVDNAHRKQYNTSDGVQSLQLPERPT